MTSPDPVATAATRRRSALRLTGVALAAGLLSGAVVAAVDHGTSSSATTPAASHAPTPSAQANDIAARSGSESVEQIASRDGQGVVSILATSPASGQDASGQPQSGQQVAEGTGFMLDRAGHLLTNDHVVDGATSVRVILQNKRSVPATVVGTDRSTDLAVIKINLPSAKLHPLTLGNSAAVRVGAPVVAIGSPFGLDHTVTAGIISAVQRQITAPNGFAINDAIQTDAAINHGNSGGPLIDAQGRVVGINAQLPEGSSVDGNVGIGFAIPINTAKPVISQIISHGKVSHAWLGISGSVIDASVPSKLRLPASHGILVSGVVPGGPADKAHLASGSTSVVVNGAPYCTGGDVITAANGTSITSFDQLSSLIARKAPGDHLTLTVSHASGTTSTINVTLGSQPSQPPATHSGCGTS